MFQQLWRRVDKILASDNGDALAALVEARVKVCVAARAARSVTGKAACPLGSVTCLSQRVTGYLS